jgi:hypothetical protein
MSYTSPTVTTSGANFAAFQAGGASGLLELLISVNQAGNAKPTAAATLSANAGGTVGGPFLPGAYFVNFTESDGVGETLPSAESGPVTLAAQAAPTGTPTVAVSGSGGTLPAGPYKGVFTYVDSNLNFAGVHGETVAGTEFSFTQTSGAEPVITIGDGGLPAWASGRNLYLTAVGGATGTEVLAFTAITATTFTITTAPAVSAVTPPTVNTTTTNIPKITAFPALQTGNVARNIYMTVAGGASGSEILYARDQTGTTFTFSIVQLAPNNTVPLPTINTTAYSTIDYQMLRSVKDGNFQDVYRRLRQVIYEFNHGAPTPSGQVVNNLKRIHSVFVVLAQLCSDMGTLLDANPGHIVPTQNGIGGSALKRVWP